MKFANYVITLILSVVVVSTAAAQGTGAPAGAGKGFRYPAYDDQGNLKYQIEGSKAVQQGNGDVAVTDVRIEVYENDKVDTVITADNCVYNQETRRVEGVGSIKFKREGIVITGDRLFWNGDKKKIEIKDNVKVVMDQARLGDFTPGSGAKKSP